MFGDQSGNDVAPSRSVRIQATVSSPAMERMIGPTKRPTIPSTSGPPITPMKMTGVDTAQIVASASSKMFALLRHDEQPEPDRKLDDVVSRQVLTKGFPARAF